MVGIGRRHHQTRFSLAPIDWTSRMKRIWLIIAAVFLSTVTMGSSLLPNGEQYFANNNGQPLNGGRVYFYVPGTTIPKDTYKDPGDTILNTNPIILDSSGRAIIFGVGAYRQLVKDRQGTIIWDQYTSDPGAGNATVGVETVSDNLSGQTVISSPNFSQQNGQTITYVAQETNTGPVAVSVNGAAPIPILKNSPTGPTALTGGEITKGNIVTLNYVAALGAFVIDTSQTLPGLSSTIASAGTLPVASLPGHIGNVSGSGTITSFGSCDPNVPLYYLTFDGINGIQQGPSLLLPNAGGNIITGIEDSLVAQCLPNNIWRVISYQSSSTILGVPTGAVMAFNLPTCPVGWIASDGTNFTADMRGVVARGLDNGRGIDPDGTRALGSLQADAFQNHSFTIGVVTAPDGGSVTSTGPVDVGFKLRPAGPPIASDAGPPRTAAETRMSNAALLYCQKS